MRLNDCLVSNGGGSEIITIDSLLAESRRLFLLWLISLRCQHLRLHSDQGKKKNWERVWREVGVKPGRRTGFYLKRLKKNPGNI